MRMDDVKSRGNPIITFQKEGDEDFRSSVERINQKEHPAPFLSVGTWLLKDLPKIYLRF